MATLHTSTLTVCQCCYIITGTGDDSGCRDYYGHDHPECDFGLEQNETAVPVIPEDDSSDIHGFRCAGCGDDYVDSVHYVDILTSI